MITLCKVIYVVGGEGSQQGPVCSLLPRLSYFVWQEGGGHLNREVALQQQCERRASAKRGHTPGHTELREATLSHISSSRAREDLLKKARLQQIATLQQLCERTSPEERDRLVSSRWPAAGNVRV